MSCPVEVDARMRVRVTVELRALPDKDAVVYPLYTDSAEAKAITGVKLVHRDDPKAPGPVLCITVEASQPVDTYRGVVMKRGEREPLGYVVVQVLGPLHVRASEAEGQR